MALDDNQIKVEVGGIPGDFAIADLPYDILQSVLMFIPDGDLQECSRVSKLWRKATTEQTFWKQKCEKTGKYVEKYMAPYYPADWREFYFKSPFARNLIKNCSGQDSTGDHDMSGWNVLSSGGHQWRVETNSPGSGPLPGELCKLSGGSKKCFATSYGWCEREQVIDLLAEGFTEEMLDTLRPTIFISEWY